MEPTPMLIASFQIEIGRRPEMRAVLETAAWDTPESNQTSRMSISLSEILAVALGANRSGWQEGLGVSFQTSSRLLLFQKAPPREQRSPV